MIQFCSQVVAGGDDPEDSGFAAAATKRVAAATKQQLQTIASASIRKKRQRVDDMSSLAIATVGRLRRIASESSLGRRFGSTVRKETSRLLGASFFA